MLIHQCCRQRACVTAWELCCSSLPSLPSSLYTFKLCTWYHESWFFYSLRCYGLAAAIPFLIFIFICFIFFTLWLLFLPEQLSVSTNPAFFTFPPGVPQSAAYNSNVGLFSPLQQLQHLHSIFEKLTCRHLTQGILNHRPGTVTSLNKWNKKEGIMFCHYHWGAQMGQIKWVSGTAQFKLGTTKWRPVNEQGFYLQKE